MAFGPHFTSQKFSGLLKTAMGARDAGVSKALLHIGAQDVLKRNVSTAEAKKVLQKLEKSGAITDGSRARREFDRQERVANQVARAHSDDIRRQRVDELRTGQAKDIQGVVREQAHGVAAISSTHSVGVGMRATSVPPTHTSAYSGVSTALRTDVSTNPLLNKPLQTNRPPLDIAID